MPRKSPSPRDEFDLRTDVVAPHRKGLRALAYGVCFHCRKRLILTSSRCHQCARGERERARQEKGYRTKAGNTRSVKILESSTVINSHPTPESARAAVTNAHQLPPASAAKVAPARYRKFYPSE